MGYAQSASFFFGFRNPLKNEAVNAQNLERPIDCRVKPGNDE
jgi:hypothetical protein